MAVASRSLRGVRTILQRGSSNGFCGSGITSLETSSCCACRNNGRRMSSARDEEEASKGAAAVRQQLEAAARENRLDFITAARILFSTPPKPRKFGLDFHLWQFFVACLPPFAVYLTAQYSRYEMRRMEKERDEAEHLKQAALAEKLAAARLADEDKNVVPDDSTSTLKTSGSGEPPPVQRGKEEEEAKLKSKDLSTVILQEKDFLAMKARLDAMEQKVQMLESARPGPTFVFPLDAEPKARGQSQRRDSQSTTEVTDKAEAGEDRRKQDKKQSVGSMGEEDQKGVQVASNAGRWQWFGTRSSDAEQEVSK